MICLDVCFGGWVFQYNNFDYFDFDDIVVVVMVMDCVVCEQGGDCYGEVMVCGCEWIVGLQSYNGGFGVFDVDNDYEYLNYILFLDYGVLFDLFMVDVIVCCVLMLVQMGEEVVLSELLWCVIDYLKCMQEKDGSWYGCWGMNYIYGIWLVLCVFNVVGVVGQVVEVRCVVDWLVSIQNEDGGWGEDGESYCVDYKGYELVLSMVLQMVWVLMVLMVVGEVDYLVVVCGICWLQCM